MATVLIALIAVGAASSALSYRSTVATVDQMMRETAVLAAQRIEQEPTAYKNVAMDTGCIPQLSDSGISLEEKRAIIDERVAMHGFRRGNIIGADGRSIFDGNDYSDREYVRQAMQGNVYVSEPLISKITGELSIMVAAPLYEGGRSSGRIVGVVYFVPQETFLNDIVSSIQIGDNCRAYMINKSGDTIADITLDTITTQNIEREAQNDPALKSRADLHAAMRQGGNGFGSIKAEDGPRFLAYAPVGGTDGWSLAVASPKANYLADTYFGILISVLVIVVSILASIVVAVKLSSNISVPMRACAQRMKQLVEGDLKSPAPEATGQDETAELTRSTAAMVTGLNTIINDIDYLLGEMANKNFDIQSPHRDAYVGGFQSILMSMRTLKVELSGTMRQIESAAGQVSSASDQVSTGAQMLSQGSVEQAATINDISTSAEKTSAAAEEAGRFVGLAGAQLGTSVEHVKSLNAAMERISSSSEEISKIIAAIENIAFQTNILALNAAVEAARAGSAGKGFAVVADEVRNLASKSDEAAKATKELIESSIASVSEGSQAVTRVTESLERTSELAGNVSVQMNTVVEAVENQTTALAQVTEGIDQISSVVQTNSATAQESAAASEELSAEASSLKQLVDGFTLAPN